MDLGDNVRACQVMSDWPFFDGEHPLKDRFERGAPCVSPWAGSDGGGVETNAEFGCILWESKKSRNTSMSHPRDRLRYEVFRGGSTVVRVTCSKCGCSETREVERSERAASSLAVTLLESQPCNG
jgi:hypothetical protein